MKTKKEWPVLQSETSKGKTKFWQIRVLVGKSSAFIETEYWQADAAHQTARKEVFGKNGGRSNATAPEEQALLEAEAQYKLKKDKGYSEDGANSSPYILPMLAHDFKKRGHDIKWPCYGQSKYDGFRCLFSRSLGFWSRGGKPFFKGDPSDKVDLNHLWITTSYVLDGELILPKPYTFQQTCEAIKKQRPETFLLEYHVFDLVDANCSLPFSERLDLLESILANCPPKVKLVPTKLLESKDQAMELFAECVEQGDEGLILRNIDGLYKPGHRSTDLQKYKEFCDSEFTIVGLVEGVGKEKGAAVYVCETNGKTFLARPRGTYEERQKIFKNKKKYIGEKVTVRYQQLSDGGIPRFPVALSFIRPEWDQ